MPLEGIKINDIVTFNSQHGKQKEPGSFYYFGNKFSQFLMDESDLKEPIFQNFGQINSNLTK